MDLDRDGYITRHEHLKLKSKWTGEEYALTGIDVMDTNHNGKVIQSDFDLWWTGISCAIIAINHIHCFRSWREYIGIVMS